MPHRALAGGERFVAPATRLLLLPALPLLLVAAVVGGLLRAGIAVPLPADASWPGQAVQAHAFLMMVGFLATVVGIERAVAAKRRRAWLAPAASALAGVAMLAGASVLAAGLAVAAALGFLVVNVEVVARQAAPHTVLLLVGAAALLVGNLLLAGRVPISAVTPWWFAFLVLTIAAERLEMTRLMRRRRGMALSLHVALGAMLVGAALFALQPVVGLALYGASLLALAAWFALFDIARRTVRAQGLSRYMAVCLLTGYAWLAVAGAAWVAGALGWPARDVALHALGLGFVFSMVLGHAPVMLPALTRVKLQFGWACYLPVALLHGSLVVRLAGGRIGTAWLAVGALGNALALLAFAVTMAGAALAWRCRHAASGHPRHAVSARD